MWKPLIALSLGKGRVGLSWVCLPLLGAWLLGGFRWGPAAVSAAEIQSFQQLSALPPEQARQNPKLLIRCLVLFFDSEWGDIYLHDGQSTQWVAADRLNAALKVGDTIELRAVAFENQGSPAMTNLEVRVIGHAPLPEAKPLALSQMASDPGQWVEISGKVFVTGTRESRPCLVVQEQNHSCVISIAKSNETNSLRDLLGSTIRARGINASLTRNGELDSARLFVDSPNELTILRRAPVDLLKAEVQSIEGLLSRELGSWTNHLVHVNGLVSDYRPGEGLWIRDPTAVIKAQVPKMAQLDLNQRVDLYGYLVLTPTGALLKDAILDLPPPSLRTVRSENLQPTISIQVKPADTLSMISNVIQSPRAELSRGVPVRLQGVVTFADSAWKAGFLQDLSGGIYFDLRQPEIRAGQWVELTGIAEPGGFAPEITNTIVTVLGLTNFPPPAMVGLDDLANGHLDSHWVSMEGVVRHALCANDHLTLTVMSRKGGFKVVVPDVTNATAELSFVDALVKVRGACSTEINDRGQIVGIVLNSPRLDFVKVIEPPPSDPFSIPTQSSKSVATFNPLGHVGRRVKVTGVVTVVMPGQGFILQDTSGGIRVRTEKFDRARVGDLVDVLGFPSLGDFSPRLEGAIFRVTGTGSTPVPRKLNAETILSTGNHDGALVEIEARLLQRVPFSVRPRLVLQDGSIIFTAHLVGEVSPEELVGLRPGSLLRLKGVCSIQSGESHEPESFRLLLSRADHVRLLVAPAWWTFRDTALLGAGLLLTALLALGWTSSLRRQVRAQTKLISQEKKLLATLLDHLPDNVYVKDLQGHYLLTNLTHARFHGAPSPDFFRGKSSFDIAPPEVARVYAQADQKIFSGESVEMTSEEPARNARGELRILATTKIPLKDSSGAIIGLVGISRDITQQKRDESVLQEQQRALATLMGNLPGMAYRCRNDRDWTMEFVSEGCLELTGYSQADLVNNVTLPYAELVHPEDRQHVWNTVQEGVRQRKKFQLIYRIRTQSAEEKWVWEQGLGVYDESNELIALEGFIADITERKRAEAKLESVHKELLETSRKAGMAEVATSVLHNVGNVLNSINVSATLMSEWIANSKVTDLGKVGELLRQNAEHLGRFFSEDPRGNHLLTYVERLAEHTKAEQAALLLELTSLRKNIDHVKSIVTMQQSYATVSGIQELIHPVELVEDALRIQSASYARHRILLVREFEPQLPLVLVDKHKVLQILVNLISNAKHAFDQSKRVEKQVTIRIITHEGRLQIWVIDNGSGISPENRTRIFSLGFTTRPEGHGFGLHSGALAARDMGGSLTAQSEGPELGATFILELPLKAEGRAGSGDTTSLFSQPKILSSLGDLSRVRTAGDWSG